MRMLVLLSLVGACGAGAPRAATAPGDHDLDLDLDATLTRRAHDPLLATPPDPAIRVGVVTPHGADGPEIDLGCRDAEITDVLRMIASTADVGLVVSDDVHARMTLDIHNVTWRQAVGVIAHIEGLSVTETDGIVLVTRPGR
jgi:hypothetical protein